MDVKDLQVRARLQRGAFQLEVDISLPLQGITAILGPSGSGKSSLLRLLAGLEQPSHGTLQYGAQSWVDTRNKIRLTPQQRRVGMVFQDYALFAHMSVAQNIGYGIPRAERAHKVVQAIKQLHLDSLAQRYPAQLSGGQKQRVALARALITEPALLLLDEPFSAVDAALRQRLRQQLRTMVREAACPTLLVTHYLEDVYYLADYIGVMVGGHILQFGHKQGVIAQPNCKAVAELVGWQNFLPIRSITRHYLAGLWGLLPISREADPSAAWVACRAEHLQLLPAGATQIDATVSEVYEVGLTRIIVCRLMDGTLIQRHQPLEADHPLVGETCGIGLDEQQVRILPDQVSGKQQHRLDKTDVTTTKASNVIDLQEKLLQLR